MDYTTPHSRFLRRAVRTPLSPQAVLPIVRHRCQPFLVDALDRQRWPQLRTLHGRCLYYDIKLLPVCVSIEKSK